MLLQGERLRRWWWEEERTKRHVVMMLGTATKLGARDAGQATN